MSALQRELGIDQLHQRLDELTALVRGLSANTGPEYLTVEQVAEMRGCSAKTIMRRINSGKLPCKRDGQKPMIHRDHAHVDP